ncbi:MAG: hypothetical protein M5R38_04645 [Candidatus Methylomirabilis sp.]|nr:hypothetical protein [Candidatus Methylomirabilis sp.]
MLELSVATQDTWVGTHHRDEETMRRQQFVIRRARPAPFGINARSEVLGYYMDAGGVWRGFVTTSVRHLSP